MFRRKELRASFQHWLNSAPAWHVRLAAFLFGMVITLFALLLSELVQLLLHRPDAWLATFLISVMVEALALALLSKRF